MKKPKILIFDIETRPLIGYAWRTWDTNLIEVIEDWRMLCASWKWYGEKEVSFLRAAQSNDRVLAIKLRQLWDQADLLVAHNGDQFDIKKSRARMIDADPTKPAKQVPTVDTKTVAQRQFGFTGNSLKDLCKFFNIPGKVDTGGFQLWKDCMAGDVKAWKLMEKYNRRDVTALEEIYEILRPWMRSHPNISMEKGVCPLGCKSAPMKYGFRPTPSGKKQRWACSTCGTNFLTAVAKA